MSEKYSITGKIRKIDNTQTFDSGFSKRVFVVTTDEKYPQHVPLEVVKDNCDKLDNYNVGDNVLVYFNVRGNEYKEKFYVNLQAWRIEAVQGGAGAVESPADDSDDLPW